MKTSGQLSLFVMASLKSVHMYLENLLYTKFCAYCLEKKCSSLEEKSLVLYWLICVGVGAWDKHLASESQIFICKIIKSPLVEPILMSGSFHWEIPLPYIGHEVLLGGFHCNTPHPRLGRHATLVASQSSVLLSSLVGVWLWLKLCQLKPFPGVFPVGDPSLSTWSNLNWVGFL